ncbi:hypothetical protein N7461_004145 [Penicillium sp. DV-2018c]|nr:hypothetical protein N7461_004145 [Penicillium sp. DV-2018c]
MPSGQGHLEGCLGLLEWCTSEGIQVELRRILAHESIPSNETADDLTKEAATSPEAKPGSTSNSNSTRRSPVLPSTPAPEETLPCWNLPPNTESIEEGTVDNTPQWPRNRLKWHRKMKHLARAFSDIGRLPRTASPGMQQAFDSFPESLKRKDVFSRAPNNDEVWMIQLQHVSDYSLGLEDVISQTEQAPHCSARDMTSSNPMVSSTRL